MDSSINPLMPVESARTPDTAVGRSESIRAEVSVASARSASEGVAVTIKPPEAAEAVSRAVREINDFVKLVQRDLEFTVDDETGRTVITVTDSETKEIIRQIPPERILAIAENLQEVRGLLVQAEA